MVQKIQSKVHLVSSSNIHHDVPDFVNLGIVKKYKNLNILRTEHNFYTKQKKFLTCASDDTFERLLFCSRGNLQRRLDQLIGLSVSICNFYTAKLLFQRIPLSYCFEERARFDVKTLFARGPVSRLIKPGDITKEF